MIISIDTAVSILKNSGIIAFPTETVYGLGGVATDQVAISKIYLAKNRPADNPLICHFASVAQIQKYLTLDEAVINLIKEFTPGPISFLLNLPSNSSLKTAVAGQKFVAVRIPNHPLALALLQQLDLPLAAPSANVSTYPSGTTSEMVIQDFGSRIDGVIDGGNCLVGLESTILDCTSLPKLKILRPGIIGETEINTFLQTQTGGLTIEEGAKIKTVVPGNKYRHYSCQTPIQAISIEQIKNLSTVNSVILAINSDVKLFSPDLMLLETHGNLRSFKKSDGQLLKVMNLGKDLHELGQSLYRNLAKIDTLKVKQAFLVIPTFDHSSLAKTLKNRLNKILSADLDELTSKKINDI